MLLLASFFALLLISMIDMHSQHAVRSVNNFFDVLLCVAALDREPREEASPWKERSTSASRTSICLRRSSLIGPFAIL